MKAVNIAEDEKAVEAVRYLADYCDKRKCVTCYMGYGDGECVFYDSMPYDWKTNLNNAMKEKLWMNKNTKKN